jgi:protein tyrosine/serine phosphatase
MAVTDVAQPAAGAVVDPPTPTVTPGRRSPLLYVILAAVVVLGVIAFWLLRVQTYHLETVDAGILYRDGNRGMREFATAVRKVKPKTVVSLIDDGELADPAKPMFAQEAAFCKANGIDFERTGIVLGGWPGDEALDHFFAIVEDPTKRPVLVHCAQGVRRTGMMVAAYQESILGWDKERVKREMLTFGHSQRTIKDVQRFVDNYDPKTRTMTTKLARSVE